MPKRPNRLVTKHVGRVPAKDTRPSAAARGYGHRWQAKRRRFLAANPICKYCTHAAEQVDHIVPLSAGGADHPSNYRAVCGLHHRQITANYRRTGINELPQQSQGP